MKKKKNSHFEKDVKPSKPQISVGRFVITYLAVMGFFYFLLVFKPLTNKIDIDDIYTKSVVFVTAKVLAVTGIPCAYNKSIINVPGISLDVKFGCNGLEAVMIYSVAVIAFPAGWKKKVIGVLAGFLVIQAVNILRIAGLAYAGIHFKNLFYYIHIYVAQGIMIAVALAVFFIYLRYATNYKTTAQ
ncbi:MAG: exosortase H [Nitrospirae bacterium]|nr:exosortase H [Nitrospirota bacterium]